MTTAVMEAPRQRAVRLRRSRLDRPGITRRGAGRGYSYTDAKGQRITDPDVLERVNALAVPPAWTDVWICPFANGHIQAVGVDGAGRKQYIYHPRWREKQDRDKFERSRELGGRLPRIRRAVTQHLGQTRDPRLRALAATVRLIDIGGLRIGSEDYARTNGSFGASTLLRRHVEIDGDELRLSFIGKSGKDWELKVKDAQLARFVRELPPGGPNDTLLAYEDVTGSVVSVSGSAVNEYIGTVAGGFFTAKDFRTWQGTVVAARALAGMPDGRTASATVAKRAVNEAIKQASAWLNNTPTMARKSYVDPRVIDLYHSGVVMDRKRQPDAAVYALLT